MIQALRVFNLALIESLELELEGGLHVITGETGAGKSILVNAVGLLSGRRVSSEVVRSGEREGRVEALFDSPELLARARELGVADVEDEELLIVRTVARQGRGRVFVNGRLATVELLGRLMDGVIDVASQGEHQRLLRPEVQTDLLDAYGDLFALRDAVSEAFARWRELAEDLDARTRDASDRARREDQLASEIEQIERASLRAGELEELEREHARLAHLDRLEASTATGLAELDDEPGIRSRLRVARARLRDAIGIAPELAEVDAALERAELECADASLALERFRAELEAEPERLEHIETRMAEIRRLQRRFGDSVEEILAFRDAAQEELERIGGGEARMAELRRTTQRAGAELAAHAERLTSERSLAAERLQGEVERELAGLDLGKARFEVRLEPVAGPLRGELSAACGPGGAERASFWLAANPGEEPKRLRDAASGGELARLLLALRNALRENERGCVLLFDEIDAGVGGETAQRIGSRLRDLAKVHDILCITHLPQVAAAGAVHFRVSKSVEDGRTRTHVERLDPEQRVDEIARMAGSGRLSATSRAHARELLSS